MFAPGYFFPPSLILESTAGAYPSEALSGASLCGRLLALLGNIRLGLKGLQRTNPLAYLEYYGIKCSITSAPCVKTLF
jgi:hypothetical protein